jgi:hypothetical protein
MEYREARPVRATLLVVASPKPQASEVQPSGNQLPGSFSPQDYIAIGGSLIATLIALMAFTQVLETFIRGRRDR